MPQRQEDYIHRIGRTGRANKAGTAISFINPSEELFQAEIETLMNQRIPMQLIPEDVKISTVITDEERPYIVDKNLARIAAIKVPKGKGAFHEKKDKNNKINLGGPGRQEREAKKTLAKDRQKGKRK